jgi:ribonuclease P protein component
MRYTYQHGKTIHGSYCALKYTPNSKRTTYRAAVVVSKKISKSAIVRNRIRRRIYETVRNNIVSNQAYDLIFTVFSDRLADIPAEELREAVIDKLRTANIGLKLSTVGSVRGIVDQKEK